MPLNDPLEEAPSGKLGEKSLVYLQSIYKSPEGATEVF